MCAMRFRYAGVRSKQTEQGHWLVQFSARATEIAQWAGVPQKTRFLFEDGVAGETVGFQRGEDRERVRSLGRFLEVPENVVQNPLLCSLRTELDFVKWDREGERSDDNVEVGELVVEFPDFEQYTVEQCLGGVREYLERRVPELHGLEPDADVVEALKARLGDAGFEEEADSEATEGDRGEDQDANEADDEVTGALYEDSHIREFWQQIAARHEIAKEVDPEFEQGRFLGFSQEALLSYLRPVVLVDGQHRLLGALAAATAKLNDVRFRREVERRISGGATVEAVEDDIMRRESRLLPVSLLMSNNAEEQVFQFVVVNQKATPVGRALLGTIISTTLSTAELERVASRLKNAGIPLEESRAVSFMAVRDESPFVGRVDRGLTGGQQDGLQWNVLASLITIFRDLRGGRLFGEPRDWAAAWRSKYLNDSPIVGDYAAGGFANQFDYWQDFDGPWRRVFLIFWDAIRDKFANVLEEETHNYWGRPRTSNLYNKISLTILAADFFQFLVERRLGIASEDEVAELVKDWLADVSGSYFDRDWKLAGIKKDVSGIRNQWAHIWVDYRRVGGRLPSSAKYRVSQNA